MNRRVVVTGMGAVCSLGLDVDELWQSIKAGKCGISLVDTFNTEHLPTKVAAQIKNFIPENYMDRKDARRMDRYCQFAMAASKEAFTQSGLDLETIDHEKMGVLISSGIGGMDSLIREYDIIKEKGVGRISPFSVPMMIANMGAGRVAIEYKAKGFVECIVTACASSANAIGDACRIIQRGEADIMFAGGAEAPLLELGFAGFCAANRSMSQSTDPLKACRPFDRCRDGFVMAEGGAVVILEELEHALARNAVILAELTGYACTCDAYHITAPEPEADGAVRCMRNCLKDSGIGPEDVGYINAHGTGTPLNDKLETYAIVKVFESQGCVPYVSSTKSMTGHLMGAAGALEFILSILAIRDGFIPPTIAYENPDEECNLKRLVTNQGIDAEIDTALTNSFGFGGHNASLIVRKFVE
ncbi:MAG: beta-ketoacyl-ACP synthase II [Clostridia bacterium]